MFEAEMLWYITIQNILKECVEIFQLILRFLLRFLMQL